MVLTRAWVLFEEVLGGGVAAPAVTEQQNRGGMGIAPLADALPVPAQAVASELAGVVTEAEVEVAPVAGKIVEAVGNDHARGPTGEVRVEGAKGPLRPHPPGPIEGPEMFFRLGIQGQHGVPGGHVRCPQPGDALELLLAIGRLPPGDLLGDLVHG